MPLCKKIYNICVIFIIKRKIHEIEKIRKINGWIINGKIIITIEKFLQ